jgi:hypothetical protein
MTFLNSETAFPAEPDLLRSNAQSPSRRTQDTGKSTAQDQMPTALEEEPPTSTPDKPDIWPSLRSCSSFVRVN